MGGNNITDTKNIILEWLNKEKAPFEIDSNSKELIADLCVEWQYETQNREKFEKDYLTSQIKKHKGNISKTAEFIGMERSALHRKLKSLGIKSLN